MSKEVRVDSFLWAVRIFKTRTLAQEACKKGRVTINSVIAKPSKMVSVGDVVVVRKPPISFSFRVLAIAANRMNAKLVPEYVENITPKEEYEAMEMQRLSGYIDRAKGLGRPTKKERRDLEQFYGERLPVYLDENGEDWEQLKSNSERVEELDYFLEDDDDDWDNW